MRIFGNATIGLPWALAVSLLAQPALAFGWQGNTVTDQGVFFATARLPGAMSIRCGGRQIGASGTVPMTYMDNVTPPGIVHIAFAVGAFSDDYQGEPIPGAALLIDGQSHSLGDIHFDDYYGEFHQSLSIQSPLLQALRHAGTVTLLEAGAIRGGIPTRGLPDAINEALDFCLAGESGTAPPTAAATPPPPQTTAASGLSAVDRLVAWMDRDCPVGLQRQTGALSYTQDLDGDGLEDAFLDPRGTTCNGVYLYCGAMLCQTPVFLSSVPGDTPADQIFGHGPLINFSSAGLPVMEIHTRCADGSFDCPPSAYRWQNGQAYLVP